jgi:hypothetical protein
MPGYWHIFTQKIVRFNTIYQIHILMPTIIVNTGSDPQKGQISSGDLQQITSEFQSKIQVNSQLTKMEEVFIPALIMQHLLAKISADKLNASFIKIKFGFTLPNQKDCKDNTTDVSNRLSVVVMIEDEHEHSNVGDFIITPGFKEFDESANGGNGAVDAPALMACCPVIKPPVG